MFLHLSVSHSVHSGGGGVCGCRNGAWFGGVHGLGGMRGWGGVHNCGGACMVGGLCMVVGRRVWL